MTTEDRIRSYEALADKSKKTIGQLKKQIYANGTLRLVFFVTALVSIYFFAGNLPFLLLIVLATAIVFALLLKRHNALADKKESAEIQQSIAGNELQAFRHDFSAFDGAPEKTDPSHPFSFDLDIFGERSVFQQINRTALSIGKEKLAGIFQHPLTDASAILQKQQAISELSRKEDFTLNFRTIGQKISFSGSGNNLSVPPVKDNALSDSLFWKAALWAIPLIYLFVIVLWFMGTISGGIFILLYIFTLGLSVIPMKKVRAVWQTFDKKSKTLYAYADLFALVESESFETSLLQKLQLTLQQTHASKAIKELSGHSRNLDVGFTLAILLLNPPLLWTTRYTIKIEQWIRKYGSETNNWFSALAETDALISLSTFALNHPQYTYPEIAQNEFFFKGEGLGHPVIPRGKCIENDLDVSRKPFFMIVTGANMAGKSTYLRTVGVNHVLASIGAPVYAKKLTFSPGHLLTNLRTADSLVNSESYFFAELKRLKMIINRLESGEKNLFIVLDEILKGTNSEDKQKGSLALMKRLVHLEGNGIIATHDLTLGDLEKQYPSEIKNYHFDATIQGDTLSFDYRLREGIAKNMNASFLMRKMGITE